MATFIYIHGNLADVCKLALASYAFFT